MSVDEAVMIAGLLRALARTCHREAAGTEEVDKVRPELLTAASWRASRYGLEGDLIDLKRHRLVPAKEMVSRLLSFVREALEEADEWEEVSELVDHTLQEGTGAAKQRRAFEASGRMEDVVDLVIEKTRP